MSEVYWNGEAVSGAVDITGLPKADVLAALHAGTRSFGMGALHDTGDISVGWAQNHIDIRLKESRPLKFDWICGRPIKVDISGDEISASHAALYDRDAGEGACSRAIARLRLRLAKSTKMNAEALEAGNP